MDEVPSEGLPGGHPGSTLESVEQALCSAAAIRGPHGAPAGDDCEDAASVERRAGADSPRGPAHPGTHHRAPRPGSSRPLRRLAERGPPPCGAGWTCAARPEASPKGRHGVGGARLWSSFSLPALDHDTRAVNCGHVAALRRAVALPTSPGRRPRRDDRYPARWATHRGADARVHSRPSFADPSAIGHRVRCRRRGPPGLRQRVGRGSPGSCSYVSGPWCLLAPCDARNREAAGPAHR